MVELYTSREMVTIPQVPFRQLHKTEGVTEHNFLSHECHAALEQNTKDALKPLTGVFKYKNANNLPNVGSFQAGDKQLTRCPL